MKLLKLLYITLSIVPLLFSSCGSDDYETQKHGLQGKWNTQYIFIETNMPSTSNFDRTINGLYKQRFDRYSITRDFQGIATGNDIGTLIISAIDKETGELTGNQSEAYTIKGDTVYITDANLGGRTVAVYFNAGENILITRHKVAKTYENDEISPIMDELGLGAVITDDNPPYGTTGIVTMEFFRIKE